MNLFDSKGQRKYLNAAERAAFRQVVEKQPRCKFRLSSGSSAIYVERAGATGDWCLGVWGFAAIRVQCVHCQNPHRVESACRADSTQGMRK